MFGDRIYNGSKKSKDRVFATEMVNQHDAPACFTHAAHLAHHPPRVGDYAYYVEGAHHIEALVRMLEMHRVALDELDMAPIVLACPRPRPLKHLQRTVDGHNLN